MIDARAIIQRKEFTAESVGGREDGSHHRYDSGSGGRSGRAGRVVGKSGLGEGEREGGGGREQVGWMTRLFPFPATLGSGGKKYRKK